MTLFWKIVITLLIALGFIIVFAEDVILMDLVGGIKVADIFLNLAIAVLLGMCVVLVSFAIGVTTIHSFVYMYTTVAKGGYIWSFLIIYLIIVAYHMTPTVLVISFCSLFIVYWVVVDLILSLDTAQSHILRLKAIPSLNNWLEEHKDSTNSYVQKVIVIIRLC